MDSRQERWLLWAMVMPCDFLLIAKVGHITRMRRDQDRGAVSISMPIQAGRAQLQHWAGLHNIAGQNGV